MINKMKKFVLMGLLLFSNFSFAKVYVSDEQLVDVSNYMAAKVLAADIENCDINGVDLLVFSYLQGTCLLGLRVEGSDGTPVEFWTKIKVKTSAWEFIQLGYQHEDDSRASNYIILPKDRSVTVQELFGKYDKFKFGASVSIVGLGPGENAAENDSGAVVVIHTIKVGAGIAGNFSKITLSPK